MLQKTQESSQTNVRRGHHPNLWRMAHSWNNERGFFFGSKIILFEIQWLCFWLLESLALPPSAPPVWWCETLSVTSPRAVVFTWLKCCTETTLGTSSPFPHLWISVLLLFTHKCSYCLAAQQQLGLVAGQLQPLLERSACSSDGKSSHSFLIAAGILQLWSHTMRNTFKAAIQWACFSDQQICLVSWREMSSIDLILLFYYYFFLFFFWLQSLFAVCHW